MRKLSTTRCPGSAAFTLVELLLVVAIIAILASLGVGLMSQAQQDAAVAATRSRISLIEKILETELEEYEVRRSPIAIRDLQALIPSTSLTDTTRTLLHVRQLRRMIIADLIRVQMPDGSQANPDLALFPSPALAEYLAAIGISGGIGTSSEGFPGEVVLTDGNPADPFDQDANGKSELLYQILLNIDIDGVPAVDQLGSRAVGNTDGDAFPEILDAWGEPLYLQWQQENLVPVDDDLAANVWESTGTFVGLSKEHTSAGFGTNSEYSKPVLPSQIRPFLTSERMFQIDGLPADIEPGHEFLSLN